MSLDSHRLLRGGVAAKPAKWPDTAKGVFTRQGRRGGVLGRARAYEGRKGKGWLVRACLKPVLETFPENLCVRAA